MPKSETHAETHASISIRLDNGIRLNVRKWPGAGTPCILIHGLAEGGFVWDDFATDLVGSYPVFAIDLRGHGQSDWDSQERYDLATHVADVDHVINQLGLERFIIIGHSLGGDIAARIMILRPREVVAAVIVDSGPSTDASAGAVVYEQIVQGYRNYGSVHEYALWLGEKRLLADKRSIERFAHRALICKGPNKYVPRFDLAVANAVLENQDQTWWWAALAAARVPVLVVRGMGSAVLSKRLAAQMVQATPFGDMAVVEMAGHSVMVDNPTGFSNTVRDLLSTHLESVSAGHK